MMDAVAYLKEKGRMTDNCRIRCDTCPFGDKDFDGGCGDFEMTYPEKAASMVEEWSKAHPIQTNADKFKEVFGSTDLLYEMFDFNSNGYGVHHSKWWDMPYEAPKGAEHD